MTPAPDLSLLSSSEKDALITALLARIDALAARVAALEAENAALREKLNLPPKTPENSSTPPSQGRKANAESQAKPKGRAHAGAYRPLHPNPTRRREVLADRCSHCHADVTGVAQVAVQKLARDAANHVADYGMGEIPALLQRCHEVMAWLQAESEDTEDWQRRYARQQSVLNLLSLCEGTCQFHRAGKRKTTEVSAFRSQVSDALRELVDQ